MPWPAASPGTFASAAYQILGSLETIRAADGNKTEFLAMLGHELRNPLAPISNSVGVLRLAGENSPAVRSVSEMIGASSRSSCDWSMTFSM